MLFQSISNMTSYKNQIYAVILSQSLTYLLYIQINAVLDCLFKWTLVSFIWRRRPEKPEVLSPVCQFQELSEQYTQFFHMPQWCCLMT